MVERTRLSVQLDDCLHPGCRLALLSAPAGFGKTTLVSAWIRSAQAQHTDLAGAWLSLDEQDNEPNRFWAYVVAAFQRLDPSFGKETQMLLSAPQIPKLEPILTLLINDFAEISSPILLALDDFHLIQEETILDSLSFLLDRMPPNFHVILLTRSDPHLPLARFRARGQLLEIRLAELRFTKEETEAFLNKAMGLNLSQAPIETLHTKTEGWAAGLQLAGLALQGVIGKQPSEESGADRKIHAVNAFVDAFSGSNRFILDYLLEEVLRRQPVAIQDFLLQTSLLERFCAPLCEAVVSDQPVLTGSPGCPPAGEKPEQILLSEHRPRMAGGSVLEYLERENLFLIPLDADAGETGEWRWYRYHQLFSDLLQKHLHQTSPTAEFKLHARASQWYEENRLAHQAVEHAFRAHDFERAGRLLEKSGEAILKHGEYQWLLQRIQKLPNEHLQTHWKLFLFQATVYASVGQLNQAEECLQAYERYRPVDQTGFRDQDWLAGSVAAVQALIAIFRGNAAASRRSAQLALETIPKGSDSPWRAHLLIALSHINQVDGNFEDARQNLSDAIDAGKQAGDIYMTLDATTHLAMMLCNQGQLRQACDFVQQGLQYVERFGLSNSTEASMLYLAWGFILCEQHDLEGAGEYIQRGVEICQHTNIPGMVAWAFQVNIRYLIARGDWPAAEEAAREASRLAKDVEIPTWMESGISALLVQVWIQQGKLGEAERFLRERGILSSPDLKITEHIENTALGRLLLAKGNLDSAERLIGELLHRSVTKRYQRQVILDSINLALLYEARGKRQQAVDTLNRALALAEPEGYLQIFLDEGEALAELLDRAASQGQHKAFAQKLANLMAAPNEDRIMNKGPNAAEPQPKCPDDRSALSQREVEVLRLLAEGLPNKEIAQRLYISLRTVKYHTTNIFTKLNVDNRTQAVVQAKTMRIL